MLLLAKILEINAVKGEATRKIQVYGEVVLDGPRSVPEAIPQAKPSENRAAKEPLQQKKGHA
jgi:hypothetical protein